MVYLYQVVKNCTVKCSYFEQNNIYYSVIENYNYIRYGSQTIDKNDVKSVSKCLTSNFLTTGPEIIKFEKSFLNTLVQIMH